MIRLKDFKRVVIEYINSTKVCDEYIDALPGEIQTVFFDTVPINSREQLIAELMKTLLGDTLYEEVMWFVYDGPVGDKTITVSNANGGSITYTISTVEDFFNYCEVEYGLV